MYSNSHNKFKTIKLKHEVYIHFTYHKLCLSNRVLMCMMMLDCSWLNCLDYLSWVQVTWLRILALGCSYWSGWQCHVD